MTKAQKFEIMTNKPMGTGDGLSREDIKPQEMCKTACENCSCKGRKGKKDYFIGKWGMMNLEDLYSSWVDWKRTGRIFQCYMRANGKGCMLHFNQIKWCEKNLQWVKRMIGL